MEKETEKGMGRKDLVAILGVTVAVVSVIVGVFIYLVLGVTSIILGEKLVTGHGEALLLGWEQASV